VAARLGGRELGEAPIGAKRRLLAAERIERLGQPELHICGCRVQARGTLEGAHGITLPVHRGEHLGQSPP
jgi:hypothetical protein